MNASGFARIETLDRDNYDTWKLQMKAVLMKNDAWEYVSGECVKPALIPNDEISAEAIKTWIRNDSKATSDIILSIKPSELKQVKGCTTSREIWLKLEETYQSKGPARKATLLKQLTLHRMEEGDDVREHVRKFHDTVDKLTEMSIDINPELLAIMLLYSLPPSFENFRCAIESRDELPPPEVLRIKILEESDARKNDTRGVVQNAMFAKKRGKPNKDRTRKVKPETKEEFKFRCHKCKEKGHKAIDCKKQTESQPSANATDDVLLSAVETFSDTQATLRAESDSHNTKWCLDSGATSHLCGRLDSFAEIDNRKCGTLSLANHASTEITAIGTVSFSTDVDGNARNVKLKDVLHVPDLRDNLLSIAKITDKDFEVIFRKDHAVIVDRYGNAKLRATRIGNLYYLSHKQDACHKVSDDTSGPSEDFVIWHRRLGHLNATDMTNGERDEAMRGMILGKARDKLECDICLRGKMTRKPFSSNSGERKKEKLEIIHSDVCGPMRVESKSGAKYFVTLIDDHSRWCEVRFLRNKSDLLSNFKEFKASVENRTGRKIKALQTDNGGEYVSKEFDDFLKRTGIQRRLSIAYNPEQNGTAERMNRTLVEMARCLLLQSGLPPSFWAEAVSTACYIRNRCPTKALNGRTPFELWTGEAPDVSHFREFGCTVFCLNRVPGKGKFDPRARKGVFLGYAANSKGYRVWLPEERKVVITRDVKFLEGHKNSPAIALEDLTAKEDRRESNSNKPDFSPREAEIEIIPIGSDQNRPLDGDAAYPDDVDDEDDYVDVDVTPRRGPGRPRLLRTGTRGRPRKLFSEPRNRTSSDATEFAHVAEVPVKEATSGSNAEEWHQAMADEVVSILKNDTWEIVKRPDDCDIIGSRMVLRNKYKPDGTLERRKARIVAQGFAQRPGIHFNETFAPVARISSIRLLVALASNYGMGLRQFDVATAYLNGAVEEEIHMEPPQGLISSLDRISVTESLDDKTKSKAKTMMNELRKGGRVCLLKKSLYGLRQAGRNWYNRLDNILRKFGAVNSESDPCLYTVGRGEESLLIAIYVDDILVASRDQDKISRFKNHLSKELEIKDLGEPRSCLGIEFIRNENRITLHQKGYVTGLLNRFGMSDCKPVNTPMDVNVKLSDLKEEPSEDERNLPYRELVGALMYLAVSTRPDIARAASSLSQFNNRYGYSHWTAAKRVLRYLKGTADLGIVYEPAKKSLTGYVDADWAGCLIDRRSYTGYVFTLNGIVSWDSKKQRTVALSSTEAEYMALTEATKECMYLCEFLRRLGFEELTSVKIFGDNMGALKLAENHTFHARSKHIDLRHHFLRDALRNRLLQIEHVSTEDMMADVLTKGLSGPKHRRCVDLMGLSSAASPRATT